VYFVVTAGFRARENKNDYEERERLGSAYTVALLQGGYGYCAGGRMPRVEGTGKMDRGG
jgi:hypothetical protein